MNMVAGRATFEIQALRDERWLTEEVRNAEDSARTIAKTIFSKGQCQGVRIIKNWERADGIVTENVIFTEMREAETARLTIVPIDDAPPCRKVDEYYRLESRATINRLFRKYIEKVYLTPTELIHNYKALSKVQEVDTLFPAAVDRVATLQAKASGQDPRVRRDEIYQAVERMTRKARRIEQKVDLPALKDDDFDQIVRRIERIAPPGEVDYYSLVVLSRELVNHRSWLGKLERLVELANPEVREQVLSLLDGVIADLVGVPSALQDLLGYQTSLAHALCAIADLYEGRAPPTTSDAREQLAVLGPLLAEGRLADTRKSLMDRLLHQLAGGQALDRRDPAHEREAFREVAQRLFRPDGLLGGPDAAAALTRRFVYLQEAGGVTGLRQSVWGVCETMVDPLFRVVYLVDLAASPLAGDLAEEIVAILRRVLMVDDIHELAPRQWPPKDKMLRLARLYAAVERAVALPEGERRSLLGTLDKLLTGFIADERIIEKLDDPDAHLRDRTAHLLQFCASRLLPPGTEAHRLACERVVGLLRQPNFEERYLDGVADPKLGEEMLRALHTLLVRGGFR